MSDSSGFTRAEIEAGRLLFAGEWNFITAASSIASLPAMTAPEIAFAGRSNVGKSSLINALTGRKALARTSNTPGRTQELIFFGGPESLVLVDMPGYGYAATAKSKIAAWTALIHDYLRGRTTLARVYILVDARHGMKTADDAILDTLSRAAISHEIVLTKCDQLKPSELAAARRGCQSRDQEKTCGLSRCDRDLVAQRRRRCRPARRHCAAADRARRFAGAKIMNNGLEGIVAAATVLSHADGESGAVWVRGHTIEKLAADLGYEGAVAVMWDGFAGEGLTRAMMQQALGTTRRKAFARLDDWLPCAARRPLAEGLRIALAALPDDSRPAEILAMLPVAIAALLRADAGKPPVAADAALTTAADLLRMISGAPAEPARVAALDSYITTVIDNGLGNSTFAARVVVSSRASLAAAALGGYCAFCGPLHGGAPSLALDMLDEIEASGDADGWIERKLDSGGRLMGFGHRVFRHRDPRADMLRAALRKLDPESRRLKFLIDVEHRAVAALQRRKPGRRVEANIEMDAALLLDAIGLPREAFTPVFAVARCAAWLAHAMEQKQTGRMIRPASTYIGPVPAE